jgi:hypothetical protein
VIAPISPRAPRASSTLAGTALALLTLIASAGLAGDTSSGWAMPSDARGPVAHPRLLIAEGDPFSGIAALRTKYAAGARPPDDLAGWALSYVLTKDESFAARALDEMRRTRPPSKGYNLYVTYLSWALAFDWLHDYPGFDGALKDRVAFDLRAGAADALRGKNLVDPSRAAYHNFTLRDLVLAAVALSAIEGYPPVEARAAPLRRLVRRAFENILETTQLVTPDGGYHESMDYQRHTWAPLCILAELARTTTGEDPADHYSVFSQMGRTYLYKVLPDGSTARDDDNEYPHLERYDRIVLGYAVHRFKDPYAAWLQEQDAWFIPPGSPIPILEFLWSDPGVRPRDPALAIEQELPRQRLFGGIGHLVMRDGWGPDSTWIELASGPYFAKHDHLDQNHFVIYHKGYLAIDSGADYTETESPHYLNYYRRTIAHNTMLVYQPGERFFWANDRWPAANDGGQRMDSERLWHTVRGTDDWEKTRALWDRGGLLAVDTRPGEYHYARADGSGAYQRSKLERFTRDLAWLPGPNVALVFDRVRSARPELKKTWLLHGVAEPEVTRAAIGPPASIGQGGVRHPGAQRVTFEDGGGRLRVHLLLPHNRDVVVRGGEGWEFWTPGDEHGGAWGSGENWPLEPAAGSPLPDDPYLARMWRVFWGDDLERISPSNRRSVVPGAYRVEVSPEAAALDDIFLNVLEIGDRGDPSALRIEAIEGHNLVGAAVGGAAAVLFATPFEPFTEGEATLPDTGSQSLLVAGLVPGGHYEVELDAPGAPSLRLTGKATSGTVLRLPLGGKASGRLRLRKVP